MSTTPSTDSRNLDVFGIMSTTTGGIGIALTLWGQLWVAERYADYVNSGHPETDGIMLTAPIPGFICAVLAIVLGTAGIREPDQRKYVGDRRGRRRHYRRRLHSVRHARQPGAGSP